MVQVPHIAMMFPPIVRKLKVLKPLVKTFGDTATVGDITVEFGGVGAGGGGGGGEIYSFHKDTIIKTDQGL